MDTEFEITIFSRYCVSVNENKNLYDVCTYKKDNFYDDLLSAGFPFANNSSHRNQISFVNLYFPDFYFSLCCHSKDTIHNTPTVRSLETHCALRIQSILQIVYMTVVLKFLSARYILRNNYQEKIVIYIYKYESEFLMNPDSKIIIYKIKLLNIVYIRLSQTHNVSCFILFKSKYVWSILFQ